MPISLLLPFGTALPPKQQLQPPRFTTATPFHSHLVINKISLISEMETRPGFNPRAEKQEYIYRNRERQRERLNEKQKERQTVTERRQKYKATLFIRGDKYEIKNDVFDQQEQMLGIKNKNFPFFFLHTNNKNKLLMYRLPF